MDQIEKPKPMGQVIQIDEARICDHLGEMVQGTVEEALNAMRDAVADRLCGASKYERTEGRKGTRAGSYERSLDTKAGPVTLKMPKLRKQTNFRPRPKAKSCALPDRPPSKDQTYVAPLRPIWNGFAP